MCSTVAFLGLFVLCGLVSGSALNRQQWNIMEFLETDSGVEQMDSPLMFGRTINAEHPQSRLSRVAREVADDKMETGKCCTEGAMNLSLNDTKGIGKCVQEVNLQQVAGPRQWTIKQGVCLLDCIAKEYDLTDGEGYLDAEKTTKAVKADNQWGPIFADKDSLITRCVAFGNSFSKERGTVMLEERKCNIASAAVANCIKAMVQINCPEDRKVASPKCDVIRRRTSELIDVLNI